MSFFESWRNHLKGGGGFRWTFIGIRLEMLVETGFFEAP